MHKSKKPFQKIVNHRSALALSVALSFLSSSGCDSHSRTLSSSFRQLESATDRSVSGPNADSLPNLQYQPVTSAFPDPMELVTTRDPEKALETLRKLSSATLEYHQELLAIVRNARELDAAHLALIADGAYFPWIRYKEMLQVLSDPRACENLSFPLCQARLELTRAKIALATPLSRILNQILREGLERIPALMNEETISLLERAYPLWLTGSEAIALIEKSFPASPETAEKILNLVSDLNGDVLSKVAEKIAYGPDRDQLILRQLNRIPRLNVAEVRALSTMSARAGLQIILTALPKTEPLTASELVRIVDSLHYGPDRDQALLDGAGHIASADLPSIKIALSQAYGEKVRVTSLLLGKLPSLSTTELASLATGLSSGTLRDQLLLAGAGSVSQISPQGLMEMVNQADREKVKVALSLLPLIQQLSASDLGLVLTGVPDGGMRDQLISAALPLVKIVDGPGAARIVERSLDQKVQTAILLIKKSPSVTGSDLDQILSVCGSGQVRDQILAQTIPLLGSLTKEEAKALHRRAYYNKDKVAVLLMSKVTIFDGTTIAEIARESAKGSSRDLIITEGLKRLREVDVPGLIALIGAADKLVESLALEVVGRIPDYSIENALKIVEAVPSDALKDRFLIRSVDLIVALDEPAITLLALAASTQKARDEVVRKGVARIGESS